MLNAVKNGDRSAFEELLKAYEPLIRSESASLVMKFPDLCTNVLSVVL